MRKPILIIVEGNGQLADMTLRLVQAQGLLVRLTARMADACDLLAKGLDIVVLAVPRAVAAVRTAAHVRRLDEQRILAVAGIGDCKEAAMELMEAGAFSFMEASASPKAILKEIHRIRRLFRAA